MSVSPLPVHAEPIAASGCFQRVACSMSQCLIFCTRYVCSKMSCWRLEPLAAPVAGRHVEPTAWSWAMRGPGLSESRVTFSQPAIPCSSPLVLARWPQGLWGATRRVGDRY